MRAARLGERNAIHLCGAFARGAALAYFF